jgi:hypothetical protein
LKGIHVNKEYRGNVKGEELREEESSYNSKAEGLAGL